jgi:hypothetical protein
MPVTKTVEIEGKAATARFDTGAFHTYVLRKYPKGKKNRMLQLARPYEVSLDGKVFVVRAEAIVSGKIEGLDFNTTVVPIDSHGTAGGHNLDGIIGAITMEQ